MMFSNIRKANLTVGLLVTALGASFASSGYAQSASTSDTDYLSALSTMVIDMDLSGLAEQTHEPTSVAAPRLPDVDAIADVVSCESMQAQAEESGFSIEVFGTETTLLASDLSTLSTCKILETGVLVSYLMPAS